MLPWKKRPAWLLGLVGLALAVVYIQSFANVRQFEAHREAAVAWTALLLIMSCGVASVAAAVEGGWDRKATGPLEATTRPAAMVVLARIWPGIAAGAAIQLCGAAFLLAKAGPAPDPLPWWLILALWLPLPFHSVIGYLLGRSLRGFLAVPLALLLSYGWLGFTWTSPFAPLRYLSGPAISGCCTATTALDPRALWVLAIFSALALLPLLLLVPKGRPRLQLNKAGLQRGVAAVLALGIVVAASLSLAAPLGYSPLLALPASDSPCDDNNPSVCLNAIQLSRADHRADIAEAFRSLEALGLPAVRQVRSSDVGAMVLSEDGVANVVVEPWMDREQVLHSVASTFSVAIQNQDCGNNGGGDGEANIERFDWALALESWAESELARSFGTQPPAALSLEDFQGTGAAFKAWREVRAAEPTAKKRAVSATYEALSRCSVPSAAELGLP